MTAKKIEGLNPVFNQEMLLEYFHENLNHARHVENERMMFITLFTALVGGALGMVAEIDSILTSLVILCILFMLSIVCTVMTERWGNVFDAHMLMAQHLYLLLCGVPESSLMQDGMLRDRISNHPFINRFYILINHYTKKRMESSVVSPIYIRVFGSGFLMLRYYHCYFYRLFIMPYSS